MNLLNRITSFSASSKGVWIVIIAWLLLAGLITGISAPAKEFAVNVRGNQLPSSYESVIAQEVFDEHFPKKDGLMALLVFHNEAGLENNDLAEISKISEWLASEDKPGIVKEVLPFHSFPEMMQQNFVSKDNQTLLLPVSLKENQEMALINDTVLDMHEKAGQILSEGLVLHITGPAGIASDTLAIFANADLVLLFSTIGLVLILLIIIYRSPLLAIIPLLAVGIVHQVIDGTLGMAAKKGIFSIEEQSLSIMMILLFGLCTDYCLFVFSRFREELRKKENKHDAMQEAMKNLAHPIFFSAGTVLAAMLILFTASYGHYQNFAPVFSIAVIFILLAGLTLIPALFSLLGRKAFWPFIPKLGEETIKVRGFWKRVAEVVVAKPLLSGGIVLILILGLATNLRTIDYSFNMIKSFPAEISSRQGYELLEKGYPKGELAPMSVILISKDQEKLVVEKEFPEKIHTLVSLLEKEEGVNKVNLGLHPGREWQSLSLEEKEQVIGKLLSDNQKALKVELILEESPYDQLAFDHLLALRDRSDDLLQASNISAQNFTLHFNGETAKQADLRVVNNKDTNMSIVLITLLITVMLLFQTRSFVAPLYMISSILLSYGAALGFSWYIFNNFVGMEALSYRIPLYTFVFLVALGIDYNIMLVSRIREEYQSTSLQEAVKRAVTLTGGVISSAGIILAATFAVLMTMPLAELYMFGFTVAFGILMDAFLVRGILVPSVVLIVGKYNGWKKESKEKDEARAVV